MGIIWVRNFRNSHFSCPRNCDGNSGQIRAGSPRCRFLAEKRGLYIMEMRSPDNFRKTCQKLYHGFIWAYNGSKKDLGSKWVHTADFWVPPKKKRENVETLVGGSMLRVWVRNFRNSHLSCPRSCDGNSGQIRAGSPRCHILAEKRGLYITEMRSPDNFHKTCQNLYLGFIWAYNDVMKPFGLNRIDFRGRKPNLLVKATNRRNVRGSHETRYLGSKPIGIDIPHHNKAMREISSKTETVAETAEKRAVHVFRPPGTR